MQKIPALAQGLAAIVNAMRTAGVGVLWETLHADWDVLIETDGWGNALKASPRLKLLLYGPYDVQRAAGERRATPERRVASERRIHARERRG